MNPHKTKSDSKSQDREARKRKRGRDDNPNSVSCYYYPTKSAPKKKLVKETSRDLAATFEILMKEKKGKALGEVSQRDASTQTWANNNDDGGPDKIDLFCYETLTDFSDEDTSNVSN